MMIDPITEVYTFDPGPYDLEEVRSIIRQELGPCQGLEKNSCIIDPTDPQWPVQELLRARQLFDPVRLTSYRSYLWTGWYTYSLFEHTLTPDGKDMTVPRPSLPAGVLRMIGGLARDSGTWEALQGDEGLGIQLSTEEDIERLKATTGPEEFFEVFSDRFPAGVSLLKNLVRGYLVGLTDEELLSDFPIPESMNLHTYSGQFALITKALEDMDDHRLVLGELFDRLRRWYVLRAGPGDPY